MGRCPTCFPTILHYAERTSKPIEKQYELYKKFGQMEFVCEACADTGRRKGAAAGAPPVVTPGARTRCVTCVCVLVAVCAVVAAAGALGGTPTCAPPQLHTLPHTTRPRTHLTRTTGPLPGFPELTLLDDGRIVSTSEAAHHQAAKPQANGKAPAKPAAAAAAGGSQGARAGAPKRAADAAGDGAAAKGEVRLAGLRSGTHGGTPGHARRCTAGS
jgi:hypothetical protein